MVEQSEGGDFPPKKPQSETTAQQQQPVDFPPKKLARQLDFTAGYTGVTPAPPPPPPPPAAPSSSSSTAAVMATAAATPSVPAPVDYPHQNQPPQPFSMASRPQLPQHIRPSQPPKPPAQPAIQLMTVQQHPVPPTAHPSIRPIKPESPRPRPRNVNEGKDGTPKKQKQCNCKHSKCLKLYCECFASGIYCDGCNCVNCYNNVENEAARREAVETTLERNPNAFRPKIASSPHGTRDNREELGEGVAIGKHNKGCHCKKSGCLKKYCECFQANILCSDLCKCIDCKNYEGSEERQALFQGEHANSIAYTNAAISGAIQGGYPGYITSPVNNKKRKGHDLYFGPIVKDPHNRMAQYQPGNHVKNPVPSPVSTIPGTRLTNPSGIGASKFTYRSLLADIIQPRDLKELCSVLVVYSAEAAETAKMLADERSASERPTEENKENHLDSAGNHLHNQKDSDATENAVEATGINGSEADKITPEESASDGADVTKGRPMSPGTLALMCDEQDTMFAGVASPTGVADQGNISSQLPPGEGVTETLAAQERIVLSTFRDCLQNLIQFGEIKGKRCSSLVRSESGNQGDLVSNGNANVRMEPSNQQEPSGNGIAKSNVPPPVTSQLVTSSGSIWADSERC
ncbi:OLC1v1037338C1 [Oldenlandia corymbosa var. corymbosa]|uniref:OLC1v1037338C1 n=1 Tax=Oldenlandia corymbosa var. corymbosa TaxID=529605 RepID=A0AAV1CY32_OLDCO|nr:OLC1v1037338C1 [Oldenlandia corymbosa var. corymbosa]